MLISTVIEILASVFLVYGIYFAIKTIMFFVLFPKSIRKSIYITVTEETSDDKDIQRIKLMCARQLAREYNLSETVKIERKQENDHRKQK